MLNHHKRWLCKGLNEVRIQLLQKTNVNWSFKNRPSCMQFTAVGHQNFSCNSTSRFEPVNSKRLGFLERIHVSSFINQEVRAFSTKEKPPANPEESQPEKLSIFQKYRKMLKEYWYVLIPVHLATSAVWFGAFFYASKSGFDIVPFLEAIGASETVVKPFRNSSLGHIAVAWALYKVATPARYTVTLGGTTLTVKFLTKRGLIKPMPSNENIRAIVKQKKEAFIQKKDEYIQKKDDFIQKKKS